MFRASEKSQVVAFRGIRPFRDRNVVTDFKIKILDALSVINVRRVRLPKIFILKPIGVRVQAAGQTYVLILIYGSSTDKTGKNTYRRRQPMVPLQFQGIADSKWGVSDR
jgi:hypothetical protein